MKVLSDTKLAKPINVLPFDKIKASITDRKTGVTHEVEREIGATMIVDRILMFELEGGELGLKAGVGAIFAESK